MKPLPRPEPCPECQVGKHINCDGTSWDFRYDEYVVCPCYEAAHDVARIRRITDE